MTNADLVADVARKLAAKLDAAKRLDWPPGSILIAIHIASDGPKKVVMTEEQGWRLPS